MNAVCHGPGSDAALLDTLAQIDVPWLTAVLRAGGHEMRIHGFAIAPVGAGNVSDTARITIRSDDPGPASLIAKFRPASDALHAHAVSSGAYRSEAGAYRLLGERADACRIPAVVWLKGRDDNINLLMEDLSTSTRAGNQLTGCSGEDATSVAVQLARLHRMAWPLTDAAAPRWLLRMPACGDYWAPITAMGATLVERRFRDDLPDPLLAVARDAGPLSRGWHDMRHAAQTITHGDPRVDNILFDDRAGAPEAILIDWQVAGLRNPMHDMGYFTSGSLAVGDRRAHERVLLDLYADEFGGARGYAMGAMVDDYRIQLVSGLMTTLAAVALLPDEPRANALLRALLERNCAAVADWQSLAALRARV